MARTLEGKTALVTGASGGIGAAIARGLASAGATVVVHCARRRAEAEAVVADIVADDGEGWVVQGDLSSPAHIETLAAEIRGRCTALDVLVNAAGIFEAEPIGGVTPEHIHRLFGVNVLGLLLTTQAMLALFGPAGGSIVNIGSLSGRMASPGQSVYAGTKGAVDAITLSLSKELGPRRIRVNALNPGATETGGLAASGFMSAPMRERILAATPLGRIAEPVDIADIAVFLASDASRWVNGQIIFAAGGLTY